MSSPKRLKASFPAGGLTLKFAVPPAAGTTVLNRLAKLYNDKSTSDVTFAVGPNKTEFFGHSAIIGAASDVFKTHFSGDWKDNKNVKLENVKEDIFLILMTYIYTDEISIETEKLLDVLQLAHLYMMTGFIKSLTSHAVFTTHSTECVWKYLTFGAATTDIELIIRCLEVIDKYPDVVFKPDFLEVPASVVDLFVGRNSLKISEYKLFQRLLEWASHACETNGIAASPENQRKVMDPFFQKIRFPIMDSSDLSLVKETGILTTEELNLVKNATQNNGTANDSLRSQLKEKVMTGFDFHRRVVDENRFDGCHGRALKYGVTIGDEMRANGGYIYDLSVCLPCAIKCHEGKNLSSATKNRNCDCKKYHFCKF